MRDQDKSKQQLLEELTELRQSLDALVDNLPEGFFAGPIRDQQGRITGGVISWQNMADRKQAEEALRKARDELERQVEQRAEELSKANEELALFRQFAESSGQGFSMADLDGRLIYLNPALCRMLDLEKPEEYIGKHLSICYSEECNRKGRDEIEPLLMQGGHWEGELPMLSCQGRTIPTWQNAFIIRDESGSPIRMAVVITDITERKAGEDALQQSHDELRAIYDEITDGIVIVDLEKPHPIRANAAICRMLGYSAEEMRTVLPAQVHPPESMPQVRRHLEAVARGGVDHVENMPFVRKDGGLLYADVVSSPIVYNGRSCRISFVHDVTERKRAQDALHKERRSLEHMLRASDHERQLIAYDIHDGLAQQLTGAIMQFQAYDTLKTAGPDEARKAYDGGLTLLRQSHSEARRLISGVRPPILDESGVVAAIAHLVHDPAFDQGPKIQLRSNVTFKRLAPVVENVIYRIVQEGLNNARKHSKSEKIVVSLVQRGERLRIEIEDRGVGFVPKAVQENHFGLEGIRERARLLGGKFRIKSKLGEGTSLRVELPVVRRASDL